MGAIDGIVTTFAVVAGGPVQLNRCDDIVRVVDEAPPGYERDARVLAASANFADIRPKNRD